MTTTRLAVVLVVCATLLPALAPGASAQVDRIVDLSLAPRSAADQLATLPDTLRVVALDPLQAGGPLGVEVRLVVLSPVQCRPRTPVTLEVALRNVGAALVAVPVGTRQHQVRRDMSGAASATLALIYPGADRGEAALMTASLYGASSVADSLVTLAPGETLRLRVVAPAMFQVPENASPDWVASANLKARFILAPSEDGTPRSSTSLFDAPVQLMR